MHYTLVDKNLLIPEISLSTEYFDILTQLYKKTYLRNKEYCENVYVVKYDGFKYEYIISYDGNNFFEFNDGIKKNLNLDLSYIFVSQNSIGNLNTNKQMTITFKEEKSKVLPVKKEIILKEEVEDNKQNEEKDKKKQELIKKCEQVMDLYNLELNNIKKIEFKIKSLDSKLEKLEKKKREKIISDISRTKGDYETWKKIKYVITKDSLKDIFKSEEELKLRGEPVIPILFTAKYNYIENVIKNEKIKNIFEVLNKINIDELYISETINLEKELIDFCNKYYELSKKELHYNFDHDWDYLDLEMNANSKSGSLTLFE
jgi:hypothetical protein